MIRSGFPAHRRFSITHRAVQRLRELVRGLEDIDDEGIRDRLDEALGQAEDSGRSVRTLDAKLGEPQVLAPVDAFGEPLFAIIKEDTVVTVLPQGHGEEILQRGQALEQRVAAGVVARPEREREEDRWDAARKRPPGRESGPMIIENRGGRALVREDEQERPRFVAQAPVQKPRPTEPVAAALFDALERGRRAAAVAAIRESLARHDASAPLLPLWNELARHGIQHVLTVGDLVEATHRSDA